MDRDYEEKSDEEVVETVEAVQEELQAALQDDAPLTPELLERLSGLAEEPEMLGMVSSFITQYVDEKAEGQLQGCKDFSDAVDFLDDLQDLKSIAEQLEILVPPLKDNMDTLFTLGASHRVALVRLGASQGKTPLKADAEEILKEFSRVFPENSDNLARQPLKQEFEEALLRQRLEDALNTLDQALGNQDPEAKESADKDINKAMEEIMEVGGKLLSILNEEKAARALTPEEKADAKARAFHTQSFENYSNFQTQLADLQSRFPTSAALPGIQRDLQKFATALNGLNEVMEAKRGEEDENRPTAMRDAMEALRLAKPPVNLIEQVIAAEELKAELALLVQASEEAAVSEDEMSFLRRMLPPSSEMREALEGKVPQSADSNQVQANDPRLLYSFRHLNRAIQDLSLSNKKVIRASDLDKVAQAMNDAQAARAQIQEPRPVQEVVPQPLRRLRPSAKEGLRTSLRDGGEQGPELRPPVKSRRKSTVETIPEEDKNAQEAAGMPKEAGPAPQEGLPKAAGGMTEALSRFGWNNQRQAAEAARAARRAPSTAGAALPPVPPVEEKDGGEQPGVKKPAETAGGPKGPGGMGGDDT